MSSPILFLAWASPWKYCTGNLNFGRVWILLPLDEEFIQCHRFYNKTCSLMTCELRLYKTRMALEMSNDKRIKLGALWWLESNCAPIQKISSPTGRFILEAERTMTRRSDSDNDGETSSPSPSWRPKKCKGEKHVSFPPDEEIVSGFAERKDTINGELMSSTSSLPWWLWGNKGGITFSDWYRPT